MKRPLLLYLLCMLHLLLGISALYGGGMLLLKPDGSLLGMNTDWLLQSPFNNYFIPAIFLFLLIGLFPLFILFGLINKPKWRWANTLNIYYNMHWAWTYSLFSGVILIIWIAVQQGMTPFFWLQSVMIFTGLLIIVFTLTPSIIKHYKYHGRKN
jgi:hypothetical protein